MKLGGFRNISFDLVAMLLDLALAMLFCSNWSRKRDRRGQKEWWTIRKSYEEIWKWFEATTERTNQQKIKYQVLFISCKPPWYSTMQSDFYFIAFFWFRIYRCAFSLILFHFNRRELCGNVKEWLIFHYRNAILNVCSLPPQPFAHTHKHIHSETFSAEIVFQLKINTNQGILYTFRTRP